MTRVYSTIRSRKSKERKELLKTLTSLDKTILTRAEKGADFLEIVNACRPYRNSRGAKMFATYEQVWKRVKELKKKELLEIG
jgi:propanediol dehydratase small subunit